MGLIRSVYRIDPGFVDQIIFIFCPFRDLECWIYEPKTIGGDSNVGQSIVLNILTQHFNLLHFFSFALEVTS